VNDDGEILHTYRYNAFGAELAPCEDNTNPFRFCAEYYDFETGRIYLRARSYDPHIGRFTQEDPYWGIHNMIYGDEPIPINKWQDEDGNEHYNLAPDTWAIIQAGNLYVYCGNNPIMFIDPSGLLKISITLIVIRLTGQAAAAITAAKAKAGSVAGFAATAKGVREMIQAIKNGNIIRTAQNIVSGIVGKGWKTFKTLKYNIGNAAAGHEWHHIVEQCQIKLSSLCPTWVHNTFNVIQLPKSVHQKVSEFYSKPQIIRGLINTGSMTVREYMSFMSFSEQYYLGIRILRYLGVRI